MDGYMVFSSLLFLYAFLPLSLLCYCLCRSLRAKNASLLIFSLIFYAWGEPRYVFLLMFMALADWFAALQIERAQSDRPRRLWLTAAIAVDLGLIGFFKYAGFFCSLFGPPPAFIAQIALPIGISFYTFQLLTYVIDVYRREVPAQKRYWDILLYAALFHQCIAGPIVRYKGIARELFEQREGELSAGVRRFSVGLAKKALLANPCGALADTLLLEPSVASAAAQFGENLRILQGQTVLGAWLGMAAFMLQIYLDFSAYSDMAIGLGQMLGLHYPENFKYPYTSRSVTEFWRRWHISLSSFFRDYVYIPLGGSRCTKARNMLNLFVVWALTGLWHGASWNFVLWGLYYFLFLMVEKLCLLKELERSRILSRIYLILVVYFGWIIFHFTDTRLGWAVFADLFALNGNAASDFVSVTLLENNLFLLAVSILACTPAVPALTAALEQRYGNVKLWQITRNAVVPVALLLLSTCALVGESYNPFIYFQF